MTDRTNKMLPAIALAVCVYAFAASPGMCGVRVKYLYHLSNFSGTIPYMWPKIRLDMANREVYVISQDGVRVFNNSGMEMHDFSHHTVLSSSNDVAIDENGTIYMLVLDSNPVTREASYSLERCNYKLEPVETVELQGMPSDLAGFTPSRIFYRNGFFYLGDLGGMKIVVTDKQGRYQTSHDLLIATGLSEKKEDAGMYDFFVDRDGGILFTTPVTARAYRLSADGKADVFGKRGSAPGRFGVPAGIVADSRGNYLVSDMLKSVIIVFDRNFNFIGEFGHRGPRPENIIVPSHMAIDDQDRLYISQLAKRGVSVFQIADKQQ